MAAHTCHAKGCKVEVSPELLMCLKHWRMVPRELQRQVWLHYRPGQCDDRRPSRDWLDAADAAIKAVAEKEAERKAKAPPRRILLPKGPY
jgi:hypothetical protein